MCFAELPDGESKPQKDSFPPANPAFRILTVNLKTSQSPHVRSLCIQMNSTFTSSNLSLCLSHESYFLHRFYQLCVKEFCTIVCIYPKSCPLGPCFWLSLWICPAVLQISASGAIDARLLDIFTFLLSHTKSQSKDSSVSDARSQVPDAQGARAVSSDVMSKVQAQIGCSSPSEALQQSTLKEQPKTDEATFRYAKRIVTLRLLDILDKPQVPAL